MDVNQAKYYKQLERELKIVCSATIQAYIDTNMFMFPAAFKHENQNTQVYLYTFYAIRQRAVLSVRRLIEPAKKNDKVSLESVVKLATKSDFHILSEEEKAILSKEFNALFNSEHTKRIKDFRDSLCHNMPDKEDIMCYYKDFMHITNEAMYILESLYIKAFKTTPTFFLEARDIALFLSKEYWQSISRAAGTADNKNGINARLDQLLNGKF
ncbi:MAG: hypothetical protein LBU87_07225 [Lactobacillales bacterium]|jgi:hypothetical protein|nr:hypothetical protein [Lactobacillales bacterium]